MTESTFKYPAETKHLSEMSVNSEAARSAKGKNQLMILKLCNIPDFEEIFLRKFS